MNPKPKIMIINVDKLSYIVPLKPTNAFFENKKYEKYHSEGYHCYSYNNDSFRIYIPLKFLSEKNRKNPKYVST